MIYVTHDQVEAMTLADKIVILNQGVMEQYGSPDEIYNNPNNIFVAEFIGSPRMNILKIDKGKIKNGNTTYKRQALTMSPKDYGLKKKRQAASDKLDKWSILG